MEQQQPKAPSAQRQSSPRFPFINLQKAIARAEQLRKAGGGKPVLVEAAHKTWGYGSKSSGGIQTVAVLKAYGLAVEVGSGKQRQLALSDDASRYFRDERPEERAKLLKVFALKPKAMQTLWNDWNGPPPEDHVARSHLKVVREFADKAAENFLGTYKDNISFTGLVTSDTISEHDAEIDGDGDESDGNGDPPATTVKVGDFIQWTSGGVDQFKTAQRVTKVWPDGFHVQVHGSPTGIPMSETTVVDPPAPPPPGSSQAKRESTDNDINVFLTGNRLQITADVDAEGIKKMRDVLVKYEEILKLLAGNDDKAAH